MFTLEDLGIGIHRVPTRDNSVVYRVDMPFLIGHEFPIEIFVQHIGDHLRFFDEGFNLHSLLAYGISFDNESRWRSLNKFFIEQGITLHPNGLVELFAPYDQARSAFATFSLALCRLNDWIEDSIKKNRSKEEVVKKAALAFMKLYPENQITYNPSVIMPDRDLKFDLLVNNVKYVDVLFADGVWSHVRKVASMHIVHPKNESIGVLNDIDDIKSKREKIIAGQFVPTMLLSTLLTSANNSDKQIAAS